MAVGQTVNTVIVSIPLLGILFFLQPPNQGGEVVSTNPVSIPLLGIFFLRDHALHGSIISELVSIPLLGILFFLRYALHRVLTHQQYRFNPVARDFVFSTGT